MARWRAQVLSEVSQLAKRTHRGGISRKEDFGEAMTDKIFPKHRRGRLLPLLHRMEERDWERRSGNLSKLKCPFPRSSPRSCVAGRGRKRSQACAVDNPV